MPAFGRRGKGGGLDRVYPRNRAKVVTDLIIRPARADERQALEDLQRRSSLALPGYRAMLLAHADAIELPLDQIEAGRVQVAERDDVTIGFCVVLPAADEGAELDGLFAEPKCWRQGVGCRLLQAGERFARSEGATTMWVVANLDAMDFYAACSFAQVGEVPTRFDIAAHMKKPLCMVRHE
jgi:N-acetylglutamate synthase-like GNAT family acetyltransferase